MRSCSMPWFPRRRRTGRLTPNSGYRSQVPGVPLMRIARSLHLKAAVVSRQHLTVHLIERQVANAPRIASATGSRLAARHTQSTLDPLPLNQPVSAPAVIPASIAARPPGIFGRRYGSCMKSATACRSFS